MKPAFDPDAKVQMPSVERRGYRHVFGPRTSAIRYLLGQPVTNRDLCTDLSDWGEWGCSGPLSTRPPELWVGAVHDSCWEGEDQ